MCYCLCGAEVCPHNGTFWVMMLHLNTTSFGVVAKSGGMKQDYKLCLKKQQGLKDAKYVSNKEE